MPSPSLWDRVRQARIVQVLAVYLGASWVVLQIADILTEALSLPEWVLPVAVLLLLVGLVIIVATAWVQSLPATTAAEEAGEIPDDWQVAPGDAFKSLLAGRLPHLTWGRAVVGGVVALSLLFGGAGLYVALTGSRGVLGPTEAGASTAAEGIAVVPFEVRGGDLEVWREGMVDLLSNNLDGVGGYRTIDPRTVMARWEDQVGDVAATVDLDEALRVAGATGARYALVGSLVGTGDRVRLVTNVYDLDSREEVAGSRAEGAAADILSLADNLAAGTVRSLLAAAGRGGAGDITPESLTTESLEALRHFLDGESHFRRGRFAQAAQSYETALAEDSLFVLAMARVSDTYGWLEDIRSEVAAEWATKALEHIDALPRRHQVYVRAGDALGRGSPAMVDELKDAVRRYPDDPEAWFLLAENYFHLTGPTLSRPAEAKRVLEEAVALDPEFSPYLVHVTDVAIMEGNRAVAEETLERYRELSGDEGSNQRYLELAIPLILGDSAEAEAALAEARDANPRDLQLVAATFGANTDRFDRAERIHPILGQKVGQSRDNWVMWSQGTRGALDEAERLALEGDVSDPDIGLQLGHVALVWGVTSEDEGMRARLAPETCGAQTNCIRFLSYALVVEGRLDDLDRLIREHTARMAAAETDGGVTEGMRNTATLLEGIRALGSDDRQGARAALQRVVEARGDAGDIARSVLADMALEDGRLDRAEQLYASSLWGYGRSKALRGLARVAEARGDAEEARRWWGRFVTLTEGADADRLPQVREARAALEG